MNNFFLAGIIILFFIPELYAQDDSLQVFTFESYLERVSDHHPLSKKAELQLNEGQAMLLQARGNFDPALYADIAEKYFNDKEYYSIVSGGLKIPTWMGLELQGGYEQNQGLFLNPEKQSPAAGLLHAGVSLPVGQGLFIDKRRAELRKAQVSVHIYEAERRILMNDLLYEAGKAYWDWFYAYEVLKVYKEALAVAEQRINAVKRGAELGDSPAIDTLEAGIQVQSIRLNLQQAMLEYRNARALLSVFLWQEGLLPLDVADNTVPLSLEQIEITDISESISFDSLVNNHPELMQYNFRAEQLDIERRLQREQLKPTLNLKYNALTEPVSKEIFAEYTRNNYRWGLEFYMPIFLRKARGSVKLAEVQLQETRLDQKSKLAALSYKATSAMNEWDTTGDQVELYQQTVRDYLGLLTGERRLFNAGESSLFLVNAREQGYINAQVRLIELIVKNRKAELETFYTLGLVSSSWQ